jgi:pyridinium-3,5-biscarboxylic acid mononucleotide synthase
MNFDDLQRLLDDVKRGSLDTRLASERILQALRAAPFEDLGFARIDTHREVRQGFPEVILGLGKTPAQIAAIAERIVARGQALLVTRASRDAFDAVRAMVPAAEYHEEGRVIALRQATPPLGVGTVLIVCAGTSDLPVAEEAALTADVMGNTVDRLYDVGVAGIHRLLQERARLEAARVVIVVAGMEGALPSVVAGLIRTPVIAVPTSVGYGASFGGIAALLGMLNSCANGVAVVNIDNGFGAACMASAINHLQEKPNRPDVV